MFSLLKSVARDAETEATRTDASLSDVLERAWDEAFELLLSQNSWKNALALAPSEQASELAHKTVPSPSQLTVYMNAEVLREIDGVAKAFGASPSATLNLAWLVAKRAAGPGRRK